MSTVRWSDVRAKRVEAIGEQDIEHEGGASSGRDAQAARADAAPCRSGDGCDGRAVSQIENGELAGIDVVDRSCGVDRLGRADRSPIPDAGHDERMSGTGESARVP